MFCLYNQKGGEIMRNEVRKFCSFLETNEQVLKELKNEIS